MNVFSCLIDPLPLFSSFLPSAVGKGLSTVCSPIKPCTTQADSTIFPITKILSCSRRRCRPYEPTAAEAVLTMVLPRKPKTETLGKLYVPTKRNISAPAFVVRTPKARGPLHRKNKNTTTSGHLSLAWEHPWP